MATPKRSSNSGGRKRSTGGNSSTRTKAQRSAAAKKAAETRRMNAEKQKRQDAAKKAAETRRRNKEAENREPDTVETDPVTEDTQPWYKRLTSPENRVRIGAIAALSAGLAAVILVFALGGNGDGPSGTGGPDKAQAADSKDDHIPKDSAALESELAKKAATAENRAAVDRYLKSQGFQEKDYCYDICVPHVVDRGANSVSEQELLTNEQLAQFLQGDNPRAVAARASAKRSLSPEGYQRWLTGEDHVRVQFRNPIDYSQNSSYVDGQVVLTSGSRPVDAGDILFVFTEKTKDGETAVNEDGNVRGDCGNPHAVPVPKGGPPGQPGGPGKPPGGPPEKPPPGDKKDNDTLEGLDAPDNGAGADLPDDSPGGPGAYQPPSGGNGGSGGGSNGSPPVTNPPDNPPGAGGGPVGGGSGNPYPPADSGGATVPPPSQTPPENGGGSGGTTPAPKPPPDAGAPPP